MVSGLTSSKTDGEVCGDDDVVDLSIARHLSWHGKRYQVRYGSLRKDETV